MMNYTVKRSVLIVAIAALCLSAFALAAGADEPRFLKKSFDGGITLKEDVVIYSSETLYEYINGQAVFYLSYGFKNVEHGFYECKGGSYYVDVYELGSGLSAFGSYRQQRDESAEALNVGAEGAILDYLAVFFKGPYYIEIIPMESGENDVEAMKLLAATVDAQIPGTTKLPPELELFPKDMLVAGSERYVDENLISYSFMGAGMVARYQLPGAEKENRVFIAITKGDFRAFATMTEYQNMFEDPVPVRFGPAKGLKGKEQYRGITLVGKYNKYVFGCLDVEDEEACSKLLWAVAEKLRKAR